MIEQRSQDSRAGASAAGFGHRRHPAHAPPARVALRPDQPHSDQLTAFERAERDRIPRLGVGELVQRLVGTQDLLSERPRLIERNPPDYQLTEPPLSP